MIELFSDYIKNIALCIIFSAFIGMLLPNNNFKKYLEFVLGFIIILVILNPIKGFIFKDNNSFELQVFSNTSQIENNSLLKQKDIYEDNQKQLILKNYKQQLNQQINELISKSTDLDIESINIEVEEDFESDNFAEIKKLELYINQNTKNKQINIKPVETISLEENTVYVYENYEDKNDLNRNYELEEKLESLISDFYKLNQDNIYIIVHTKLS